MNKRFALQCSDFIAIKPFFEINIVYLKKMMKLCKDQDIELILLDAPLHGYFIGKLPDIYIDKLNGIFLSSGLKYVNLSEIELSDSCFLPDGDHVSRKGAEIVTRFIRDSIE
jgi:hypothetical protein